MCVCMCVRLCVCGGAIQDLHGGCVVVVWWGWGKWDGQLLCYTAAVQGLFGGFSRNCRSAMNIDKNIEYFKVHFI